MCEICEKTPGGFWSFKNKRTGSIDAVKFARAIQTTAQAKNSPDAYTSVIQKVIYDHRVPQFRNTDEELTVDDCAKIFGTLCWGDPNDKRFGLLMLAWHLYRKQSTTRELPIKDILASFPDLRANYEFLRGMEIALGSNEGTLHDPKKIT